MEKSRRENLLVVRLSDGEELEESLKKALKQENISSGIIIGGVGMVRNAALSFYKGRGEYETVPIDEPAELCALSGNISTMDGEIVTHLHAVVGRQGGAAMAGHLSRGQVNMTSEIAILEAPQKLARMTDPDTGLRLLKLQ